MKPRTLILTATICILATAAFFLGRSYYDKRMPNFRRSCSIYVYPESTLSAIFDTICVNSDIKSVRSLRRCFDDMEVSQYMKPGHYVIKPSHSSAYVARMLNNAWQTPVRVSLSGTMKLKSVIARKVGSQLLLDSLTVHNALNDSSLLAAYGFRPDNVFAMIHHATYEMYWTADIHDFLAKQKSAYDQFWTSENDALAQKLGLSRDQVCTLASIVTAESNYIPELPKIAGVYLNRLALNMPLQADPTVAFYFNYEPRRILRKHLAVDSPYNTYKHRGLPPGPICVPTYESLNAVLNPDYGGQKAKGNLYFCADSARNGSHLFAKSYRDHLKNARAFQKSLSQKS